MRPTARGGLGLPNLWLYYHASRLAQIAKVYSPLPKPDWLSLERQMVPHNTIDYLLWREAKRRPQIHLLTFSHSLAIHDKHKRNQNLFSCIRPLDHLFHNPAFPPGLNIAAFKWWTDKGMYRIGHYFTPSGPITLKHCRDKLEMPPSETFRFHQINHFLQSLTKGCNLPLDTTAFEKWCIDSPDNKGGISIIYAALIDSPDKPSYMTKWERDLNQSWDIQEWYRARKKGSRGFHSTSLIEANCKVLMRWYMTPMRLHKAFPQTSPLCFRNCGHVGSILHIFWECPHIREFWGRVFRTIRKLTGAAVPQTPAVALLNFNPTNMSTASFTLMQFILLGAKIVIARAWRSPSVSFTQFKRKVSWMMTLEKSAHIMDDTTHTYDRIWTPWATYMGLSP